MRDYQADIVEKAREGLRKHRAFMIQMPTGSGKTMVFSSIISMIRDQNKRHGLRNRVWIIAPRNELLDQASEHLKRYQIQHGFIRAGMSESRAFDVHIVSKQTLDRRWDKIKIWPNIIIIDEAHLNYEFQADLMARAPETTKILGFTATPERTNGDGLKEKWVHELDKKNQTPDDGLEIATGENTQEGRSHPYSQHDARPNNLRSTNAISSKIDARSKYQSRIRAVAFNEENGLNFTHDVIDYNIGGIYGGIAYGPSIPWLTERGFLAPLRYFAPPINGLDKLHWRAGEIDEEELDDFLEKRKVYGDVVKYYQKHGRRPDPQPGQNPNKPALIFCRSVKSAKETARHFEEAGFKAIPVYGSMPKEARDHAYEAMRQEKIDVLTNCDLATFGLDIPNLEYAASIRPTQSRSLYFQKVGRILRPAPHKTNAVFFDHFNLLKYNQIDEHPGIPLFFLDDVQWNFEGRPRQKKKKQAEEFLVASCPFNDYEVCINKACRSGCVKNGGELKEGREELEVDEKAKLKEIKAPVKFNDLAPEERREVQDGIGKATDLAVAGLKAGKIEPGPIGDLLRIAKELGRKPMWVYYRLTEEMKAMAVQAPLLYEIARQLGYKPQWAKYQIEALRAHKREAV